jgi:Spy/CpxP family protein refolding chaperone
VAPVFEQLDLSSEQRREFERHRGEFLEILSRLGGQLEAAQFELIDLVAEHNPDRAAIAAKQGELRRLQGSIQSAVIEHLIQQGALLDEGRRARFFALLKARAEATGPPRPPWLRPPGGPPSR